MALPATMQSDLDKTQVMMDNVRQFQTEMNLMSMAHKAEMSALEAQKNAVQQIKA